MLASYRAAARIQNVPKSYRLEICMLLILGRLAKFLIFTPAMEHIGRNGAHYRFKFSRATGASWALYHELQGIRGRRSGAALALLSRWCGITFVAESANGPIEKIGPYKIGRGRLEQRGGARLDFGQRGC